MNAAQSADSFFAKARLPGPFSNENARKLSLAANVEPGKRSRDAVLALDTNHPTELGYGSRSGVVKFFLSFCVTLLVLIQVETARAELPASDRVLEPRERWITRNQEIDSLRTRLQKSNPETFKPGTYLDAGGGSINYRLFEPQAEPGQRYPLVLVLHGAGSRGADNLAQITGKHVSITAGIWTLPENQKVNPCFVLVPQCPPEPAAWIKAVDWDPGHQPFHEKPAPALLMAVHLLEALIEELPVDKTRLYVLGASMGGYGTWDLLTRYPHRFAAAVPVCGALADGQAARLAHIPAWIFHGTADDVVPVACSQRAFDQLRRAGGKPRYTEFDGGDHGIALYAWTEPGLIQWMFAQKAIDSLE